MLHLYFCILDSWEASVGTADCCRRWCGWVGHVTRDTWLQTRHSIPIHSWWRHVTVGSWRRHVTAGGGTWQLKAGGGRLQLVAMGGTWHATRVSRQTQQLVRGPQLGAVGLMRLLGRAFLFSRFHQLNQSELRKQSAWLHYLTTRKIIPNLPQEIIICIWNMNEFFIPFIETFKSINNQGKNHLWWFLWKVWGRAWVRPSTWERPV